MSASAPRTPAAGRRRACRRGDAARPDAGDAGGAARAASSACARSRSATSRCCCCAPVAMIFYRTFEHGLAPVWDAVTAPNAMHAFWLSIELVAIAVPLNTVFGIGIALLLERGRFRGKALLGLLIDLPFAISPVVVGPGARARLRRRPAGSATGSPNTASR